MAFEEFDNLFKNGSVDVKRPKTKRDLQDSIISDLKTFGEAPQDFQKSQDEKAATVAQAPRVNVRYPDTKIAPNTLPAAKKEPVLQRVAKTLVERAKESASRLFAPKMLTDFFGIKGYNSPVLEQQKTDAVSQAAQKELGGYESVLMHENAFQSYQRTKRQEDRLVNQFGVTADSTALPDNYKEPVTFWGQAAEGFKESYYQTASAIGSTIESVGVKAGSPKLRKFGEQQADKFMAVLLNHPEWTAPPDTSPTGTGGKALLDRRYYGRTLGQLVPSVAGTFIATLGTLAVTKNPVLAFWAGATVGAAQETGTAYQQMLQQGISPQQAAAPAQLYGAVAGVLENINEFRLSGKIIEGAALEPVKRSFLKTLLTEMPKSVGIEASTEGAQQFAQNVITKWLDSSQGIWDGVVDSSLAGAVGGVAFGGAGTVIDIARPQGLDEAVKTEVPKIQASEPVAAIDKPSGKADVVEGNPLTNPEPATAEVSIAAQTPETLKDSYVALNQELANTQDEIAQAGLAEKLAPVAKKFNDFVDSYSQNLIKLQTAEQGLPLLSVDVIQYAPNQWEARTQVTLGNSSKTNDFHGVETFPTKAAALANAVKEVRQNLATLDNSTQYESERTRIETALDALKSVDKPFVARQLYVANKDSITSIPEELHPLALEAAKFTSEKDFVFDLKKQKIALESQLAAKPGDETLTNKLAEIDSKLEQLKVLPPSIYKAARDEAKATKKAAKEKEKAAVATPEAKVKGAPVALKRGTPKQGASFQLKSFVKDLPSNQRFIDNAEALGLVRQYFGEDEVAIQFVNRIVTPTGAEAYGKYTDKMIQLINNPHRTTPEHEVVHAYLDLFIAPEEKQKILEEVQAAHEGENLSYVDAEERLADDFVAYVRDEFKPKTLLQKLFDGVIKIIKNLAGSNRAEKLFNDIIERKRPDTPIQVIQDPGYVSTQLEYFQEPKLLTTKFIESPLIAGRDSVSYEYAVNALKSDKLGLKKAEANLIRRVLDEQFMDEKKIPVAELDKAIQGELLPLTIIESDKWANYGVEPTERPLMSELADDIEETKTFIIDSGYEHGETGHFSDSSPKGLFGHIRIAFMKDGTAKVLEIQSDAFQKDAGIDTSPQQALEKLETNQRNTESEVSHWSTRQALNKGVLKILQDGALEQANGYPLTNEEAEAISSKYGVPSGRIQSLAENLASFMFIKDTKVLTRLYQAGETLNYSDEIPVNGQRTYISEVSDILSRTEWDKLLKDNNLKTELDVAYQVEQAQKEIKYAADQIRVAKAELKDSTKQATSLRAMVEGKAPITPELKLMERFGEYRTNWHELLTRLAFRIAAARGMEKIQFPTAFTATKIEDWDGQSSEAYGAGEYTADDVYFGNEIEAYGETYTVLETFGDNSWVGTTEQPTWAPSEDEVRENLKESMRYSAADGEDTYNEITDLKDAVENNWEEVVGRSKIIAQGELDRSQGQVDNSASTIESYEESLAELNKGEYKANIQKIWLSAEINVRAFSEVSGDLVLTVQDDQAKEIVDLLNYNDIAHTVTKDARDTIIRAANMAEDFEFKVPTKGVIYDTFKTSFKGNIDNLKFRTENFNTSIFSAKNKLAEIEKLDPEAILKKLDQDPTRWEEYPALRDEMDLIISNKADETNILDHLQTQYDAVYQSDREDSYIVFDTPPNLQNFDSPSDRTADSSAVDDLRDTFENETTTEAGYWYPELSKEYQGIAHRYESDIPTYLKKLRKDQYTGRVNDPYGFSWFESSLSPEDRGATQAFQTKEQADLSEEQYKVNRDKNGKSQARKKWDKVVNSFHKFGAQLGVPISTRLGSIAQVLKSAMRKYEFEIGRKGNEYRKAVLPFIAAVRKMKPADFVDFDLALKNRDDVKTDQLLAQYGLEEEFKNVRDLLNNLRQQGLDVGYDIGYLKDYYPRSISDPEGLIQYLHQTDDWSMIAEAIAERERKLGRVLTMEERAGLANTLIRGYGTNQITLGKRASMKERTIPVLDAEINEFYADSVDALLNYIQSFTEAIESRKFFGRTTPSNEFDKIDDSIGGYVIQLINDGVISPAQEKEVSQLLKARFNYQSTYPFIALLKNVGYIDTMGSFTSAITQIGDLGFAIYRTGFYTAGKQFLLSALGKEKISRADLGIDQIAEEFRGDKDKVSKAVRLVFKAVGLEWMDGLGKDTYINAIYDKYSSVAKRRPLWFIARLRKVFGNEYNQVVDDLANGVISDNVKLLLFNEISGIQPLSLSEMPAEYLTSPGGRVFYMLKTFTIKQFDNYRTEVFDVMKKNPLEGTKRLLQLSAALILMNASADELKDLLLGRKTSLSDRVIDNALRLMGFSKFQVYAARQQGIQSLVATTILPPTKFANAVMKDIQAFIAEPYWETVAKGETVQSIPVVGKLYYWWFGKGADTSEKNAAKIADTKIINKYLEKANKGKDIEDLTADLKDEVAGTKDPADDPALASRIQSLTTKFRSAAKKQLPIRYADQLTGANNKDKAKILDRAAAKLDENSFDDLINDLLDNDVISESFVNDYDDGKYK